MGCKYCQYCQEWKRGGCFHCPDRHEDEREENEEEDCDD